MGRGVVFVWEVKSICRSEMWNPNVQKHTLYGTGENVLIREYHKFNFSESYGAEVISGT